MNTRQREFRRCWPNVRRRILARDRHECIVCGRRSEVVHHILSRGAHPEFALDEQNLCVLCHSHHDEYANTQAQARRLFAILKERFPKEDYGRLIHLTSGVPRDSEIVE